MLWLPRTLIRSRPITWILSIIEYRMHYNLLIFHRIKDGKGKPSSNGATKLCMTHPVQLWASQNRRYRVLDTIQELKT